MGKYELMLRRMTQVEVSVGLTKSRFEAYPPQQFNLTVLEEDVLDTPITFVRADLGSHLKYSQRWSGVRAGVLLGAQGAVRRGESRRRSTQRGEQRRVMRTRGNKGEVGVTRDQCRVW